MLDAIIGAIVGSIVEALWGCDVEIRKIMDKVQMVVNLQSEQ